MRFVIYLIIVFITLFNASCIKDPCNKVFCNNSGECINGDCLCADGYTGLICGSSLAAYIAGDYKVTSNCYEEYDVTISSNSSISTTKGIKIENLLPDYVEFELNGIVVNTDSLFFEFQTDSISLDTINQQFDVIESEGNAWRDPISNNLFLKISFIINCDSLTCEKLFVED